MIATSSRIRSLKKAALPVTGPKASVIRIPESEYQPKPLDKASPVFTGIPSSSAAITPPISALTSTTLATSIPRRLRIIWRSVMPLPRS